MDKKREDLKAWCDNFKTKCDGAGVGFSINKSWVIKDMGYVQITNVGLSDLAHLEARLSEGFESQSLKLIKPVGDVAATSAGASSVRVGSADGAGGACTEPRPSKRLRNTVSPDDGAAAADDDDRRTSFASTDAMDE